MPEQELASIMKFIIDNTGNPYPYYHSVPQDFIVPAVYFPSPEIESAGDTLLSYAFTYTWFVKFFHKDVHLAYNMGLEAITAIQRRKNLIPIVAENGELIDKHWFRLRDPQLRAIDNAAQLTLMWNSYRPYDNENAEKAAIFNFNIFLKTIQGGL